MKLPAMPVKSGRDATMNFDRLQTEITEFRNSVAIAYRGTQQKFPNAVSTRVKLDTVIYDPGSNIDLTNGWYVVPADGCYQVSGNTVVELAKGFCLCAIRLNTLEKIRGTEYNQTAETVNGNVTSGILFARKGEHIELALYHEKGVGTEAELGLAEYTNRLSVVRVA